MENLADRPAIVASDPEGSRDLSLLPKAHLHLHLDGAMRASTLGELAARNGEAAPLPSGYGSFAHFSATIEAAARCMRTADDVFRVVDEIAQDAASAGAVWVELSMWPGLFNGRLGPLSAAVRTVLDATSAASASRGLGIGLVVAANRGMGAEHATELAHLAARFQDDGVVGFGLDGDEVSYPPAMFGEACTVAREAGLPVVPHAGELLGPDSVADAVDVLGARRVMHGVRCVEDPELTARLVAADVVLDICPTSNVMLSVVPSLAEHPLPRLLEAGVRCTVNADDPLLFGTDLLNEYGRCREQMSLSDKQLAGIARTSLLASAAPRELVDREISRIEGWLTPA